jgi:hypothetical protein
LEGGFWNMSTNTDLHAAELRAIYKRVLRAEGWPVGPGEWAVMALYAVVFAAMGVLGAAFAAGLPS